MIEKDMNNNDNDINLRYKSPEIKVIEVKAQHVLCQSNGNASMYEKDLGDGGFVED